VSVELKPEPLGEISFFLLEVLDDLNTDGGFSRYDRQYFQHNHKPSQLPHGISALPEINRLPSRWLVGISPALRTLFHPVFCANKLKPHFWECSNIRSAFFTEPTSTIASHFFHVSPGNTPARATVQAKLAAAGYKVEIMVVAAR